MRLPSAVRERRAVAQAERDLAIRQAQERQERLLADPRAVNILDALRANGVTFNSRSPIYRGQLLAYRLRVVDAILAALDDTDQSSCRADAA